QKLGRYEAAINSYDKLLSTEPQHPKLWYARGLALRKLGRTEAAIASFQQALEIQPSFYPATRSKLFLLLTRGQRRHLTSAQRATLRNDLNNVLDSFSKTKLPGLVTIALVALVSTHSHSIALSVSAIFLLIAIARDLLTEAQR
ncbi:MAG TPA: tetratricopeptide repeat protein, partial [Thermosynechococcaceae cyanobacterium]